LAWCNINAIKIKGASLGLFKPTLKSS